GEELRVGCELCTPGNVDDVLPAGARKPGALPAGAADDRAPSVPAFEPVPGPRSLPVARLSYSALESYKRCGYRFYLERVAGLRGPDPGRALRLAPPARNGQLVLDLREPPPEEAPPGVTPLLRGTIVHQLLERFDFDRPGPPPPGDVEELIRAHGAPITAEEVDRVRGMIEGFARSPLRERVAASGRV